MITRAKQSYKSGSRFPTGAKSRTPIRSSCGS